jgi:hypothetical protein
MFPALTLSSGRAAAIDTFQRLRLQGRLASLWYALHSGEGYLKDFDTSAPTCQESRRYLGLQDVPVDQITGSLGRSRDFDPAFRPIKSHLRDRWVAVYLLAGTDGWEPVRLHKVGAEYYVEDGHHRVSVSRQRGMAYVQAEVWEYTPLPCPLPACPRQLHQRHLGQLEAACG